MNRSRQSLLGRLTSSRHPRFDRDADTRRARAQAHLDRVRGRRKQRGWKASGPSLRGRRLPVLAIGLGAALGMLFGDALILALGGTERPVERIAVRGAERLTALDVAAASGIATGAPIGAVDEALVAEALSQHDWIGSARALRLPGGLVVVEVLEREAVATVAVEQQLYAVAADGEPFAPLAADALPELVRLVPKAGATPREPSEQLATAVHLARRLPELGLAPPSEVRIAPEDDPLGYGLRLAALEAQVVLGRTDLDARLDALARLLASRPDVVADATSIDLRFADQVVLRSAPAQGGSAKAAAGRGVVRPRNQQPTG